MFTTSYPQGILWILNCLASVVKTKPMRLQQKHILIIVFLLNPFFSIPCGNEYYTSIEIPVVKGKLDLNSLLHFPHDNQYPYWTNEFGTNIIENKRQLANKINPNRENSDPNNLKWNEIAKALSNGTDYKLLSDYAWYELRVGNKVNAVNLLKKLYEKYPNEYNVVANLGTAYEVIGHNQQAFDLLKKAVAINPNSHFGSEWIHTNILEQKLNPNPDYKQIMNLPAADNYEKWLTGKLYDKNISPDSLMIQMAYQLHERIGFIAAPDPVVGQLLMDFADLVTIARSEAEAKQFYEFAISYDSSLGREWDKRKMRVVKNESKETKQLSTAGNNNWWYIPGAILLAGLVGFIIYRQRRS